MLNYYIAANGDDTAAGTSTAPWKTLDKVNAVAATSLVETRFNFRRGDTFYGKLRPPATLNATNPGWMRFGAYGDNPARPKLCGYKILNTASGWVQHDANTWKVDCAAANVNITYTGNGATAESDDGDVGMLRVDGVIKPRKLAALTDLTEQWDHCSVGTTLYVRSTAKPTTLAADIRGTFDLHGVYGNSATEFTDLHIEGYGATGIYMGRQGVVNRVRIVGCEINDMGGSYLGGFADGTTRYGNGIVGWTGNSNVHAEHNIVHDIWDSAFTIQGGNAGQAGTFANILWRRNLTYRCGQSEEYFYRGTGPGFNNLVSEYNTNLFMGYQFGWNTRPETHIGVGPATYGFGDSNNLPSDITFRRNIYYDTKLAYTFIGMAGGYPTTGVPPGIKSDRNVIALRPGTLMTYGVNTAPSYGYTIETAENWASVTGWESKSQFVVLPASTDTDITDADVQAGIAALDRIAVGGQPFPIHAPWR